MKTLKIVQISTVDLGGGAESIAWSLHNAYRELGHESLLIVGTKLSDDPDVRVVSDQGRSNSVRFGLRLFEALTGWQGIAHLESRKLPQLLADNFDLVHAHNLHGAYFSLSVLRKLSARLPVILTLHDHWLLTGHCAHPFSCERWLNECGACPDLSIYPHIRRDGTRFNWRHKRRIFRSFHPHVVTPSKWLADRVDKSFLSDAPREVTYNGVDTDVFSPGDTRAARERLGLDANAKIILFIATGGLDNPWKDSPTLLASFDLLKKRMGGDSDQTLLLVVGQKNSSGSRSPNQGILFRPRSACASETSDYYRAADVLAYTSTADNCPLVILEAMACGLPVVASAVGGIPELIDNNFTGFLIDRGDVQGFAGALEEILKNRHIREKMAAAGRAAAISRFDLHSMTKAYLSLYRRSLGAPPETPVLPKRLLNPSHDAGRPRSVDKG